LRRSSSAWPVAEGGERRGKLGDLYGRERIFQVVIALFLFGSGLCGLSQSLVHQ